MESDSSRQETSLERHKPVYTGPAREAAVEERRQDSTSGAREVLGSSSDLSAIHRADDDTDSQAAIADAIFTFEEQRKPPLPSTLRMGRPSETGVGLVRETDELPNDGDNGGTPGELETSHNRIPRDHIDADEVLLPSLQEYRKPRLRVRSIERSVQRDDTCTDFHRGQLNGGQETASAEAEVPFETLPILQPVRIAPEFSPSAANAVVQSAHTASASPFNRRQSRWWSFRRSEHSARHVEPFMLFSPESYSAETESDNPDNPSTSTTRALGPVTEREQEQGEMHVAIASTTPSRGVLVREMLERAHQRLTRLENADRGRREDDLPPPPYHEET
ncbi:hypothetical protein H0H93_011138 [Arthromyces matolae]|nr:hypothetical protein H0H93_011138 [Arthromyces matolae]